MDGNSLNILQLSILHSNVLQSFNHLILGIKIQCSLETCPSFLIFLFLYQKQASEHMCFVIIIGV